MVHFLRNDKNRTIIECEVYNDDLSSSANIEEFIKSLEEYRNYVDDIKFSKRKDVLTKLDDAQLNEIDLFVKNLGKTFE